MPEYKPVRTLRHPDSSNAGARLRSESGLTLVEVIVSALLVGLISLSLIGLDAAGSTSADQQRRTQAVEIAQQDQERLRGMSADQLAHLNQTRTVTLDGVPFTVTSTGQFLSSSSGQGACSATGTQNADYARVSSTVDWSSNRRPDVLEESIITPPRGGSLLVQVVDENNTPLTGATATVAGTDANTDVIRRQATTDASGCAIFGGLLPGDYDVEAVRTGYIDANGDSTPTTTITATAGNTATARFVIGQAGSASATFTTFINSSTLTGQRAPSLSWMNPGMATNGFVNASSLPSSITTPTTLFPFVTTGTGVYTDNFALWAGRCTAANPPAPANQRFVTVSPGSTSGAAVIQLPAMDIRVNYQTSSSTTRVRPDQIELTDACGQTWDPAIRSDAATSTLGSLSFPGQPYGATYTVCADDNGYRRTVTASNTTYTAATSITLTIDSRSSSNRGTC